MRHPLSLNTEATRKLEELRASIEQKLDADMLALIGAIQAGAEHKVRRALEPIADRRRRIAIILHTGGGVVEVAERMVNIIRHFYPEVTFLVPDVALSAGTVFAMSGDAIVMDYFSCLGPIDPQVEREGKLVPALSYLTQYDRLIEKAQQGTLTNAEFAILSKFDLAELHQYEMAKDLSVSLLVKWLTAYKFKDWQVTETRKLPVTQADRERRAKEIAVALMDNARWGSHGRGIPMEVLQRDLQLRIDDLSNSPDLSALVHAYFELALDYMTKNQFGHFAHSRVYL